MPGAVDELDVSSTPALVVGAWVVGAVRACGDDGDGHRYLVVVMDRLHLDVDIGFVRPVGAGWGPDLDGGVGGASAGASR